MTNQTTEFIRTAYRIPLFVLMLGAQLVSAGQIEIVVPKNLASTEGNSTGDAPFGGGPFRYQQVFDASQFSSINLAGGWINGMILRADGGSVLGGPGYSVPSLQINFSTTSKLPDGLSSTFAQNVGADDTVVFGPALRGVGALYVNGSSPQPFYELQAISFSNPFFYDPLRGNLLMDIRNNSGGTGSGAFDAELTSGDAISSVIGFSDSQTAFYNGSYGLIFDFQVTPVPEPSSMFIFLFGIPVGVLMLTEKRGGAAE
jgi:hypothetical protein